MVDLNVANDMEEREEEDKPYPAPLANHEEVVESQVVFMDTLRKFHSALGTRFMVPVIGGKDLDLHHLYVQVTGRGGYKKVVTERRWKDVMAEFNFPPTTTSASFVLKRYYISLLHHYEQVYFFRLQGPSVSPTEAVPFKSPYSRTPKANFLESSSDSPQASQQRKRIEVVDNLPVTGMIDGQFDNGYLVTITLGTRLLRGVLFHSSVPFEIAPPLRRGRKRAGWRWRDPSHPKPNRSAYNFFFAEKHSKLKLLYPQREREFSRMIGESWSKLTAEERMLYQDCGLKDKERYKREMQEYKERLKLVQGSEKQVLRPELPADETS